MHSLTARKFKLLKTLISHGEIPLERAREFDMRTLRGAFLSEEIIVQKGAFVITQEGYDVYKMYQSIDLSRKNAKAPVAQVFRGYYGEESISPKRKTKKRYVA